MKRVAVFVLLSIAAWAADKNQPPFVPQPVASYPGHQTFDQISIAAQPFATDALVASAFGKADLLRYGFLPVLVVIENNTGKTLRLDLKADYIDGKNGHLDAERPADLVLFDGTHNRSWKVPGVSPIPLPRKAKKGPLNTWEIEGRAFVVKLLPKGERASGFFYFDTTYQKGARLQIEGIKDAASGKDFFYFDVPFEDR